MKTRNTKPILACILHNLFPYKSYALRKSSTKSHQILKKRILHPRIPRLLEKSIPILPKSNPAVLLLNALALNQPQKAVSLWLKDVKSNPNIQNMLKTASDYAKLILAIIGGESPSFNDAKVAVVDGKKRKIVDSVLDAMANNKVMPTQDLQAAILRAEGLSELGPILRKALTYSYGGLRAKVGLVIFDSLAHLDRHEGASLLLSKLRKTVSEEDSQNYELLALRSYYNINTIDKSLEQLLERIECNHFISINRNKALMQFYANFGRITPVFKYMKQLKESRGARLDSECYDSIIKAHVMRGQLGDAITSYSEMRNCGLEALDTTYIYLIDGHADAGDVAGAVRFFYKKQSVPGYIPNQDVCAALLSAYASNGEAEKAWKTVKMCLDTYKTPFLPGNFLALARIHANKHTHMLRDFWSYSQIINDEGKKYMLAQLLIKAMMDLNTEEGARGVIRLGGDLEKELGIQMSNEFTTCMASAYAYLNDVVKAEEIISSFPVKHRKPYNLILKSFATKKDVDGIKRIRGLMSSNGIEPDNDTYECLLTGDPLRQTSVMEEMYTSGWFPSSTYHPMTYKLVDDGKHILSHFN